jgi:beta-galactosidase
VKGAFEPERPVVHIGVMDGGESIDWNDVKVGQKTYSESWNWPAGSRKQVCAFTNAEEVELFVNGASQGRLKNDTADVFRRGVCAWQVPYGEGGRVVAVAYNGGKEVARHEIETTGDAERLEIEEEEILPGSSFTADGMSLKYLWIKAVDAKGRVVPTANEEVTVTVSGASELVTLDNGDHYTDELFMPESHVIHSGFAYFGLMNVSEAVITTMTRHLNNGRLLIILRSGQKKGRSQVQVTSGFFKPVKKVVKVLP